jgi:UDP-glucose 4-epimerase
VIFLSAVVASWVIELAQFFSIWFGFAHQVTNTPPRNVVVHAYSSHEKARQIFGDTKPVTLEEGIERMAAWAKRVGARESSTFGNIEVTRNLPASWQVAAKA